MKFNVGDKVRVKRGLIEGVAYGGLYYSSCMTKYQGDMATITKITSMDNYLIDIDHGFSAWNDKMLEPMSFTKSDLKDGMVVEQRDGDRLMVLGSRILTGTGYNRLSDFNDELIETRHNNREYDIVKVYKVIDTDTIYRFDRIFEDRHLELIWERKEEPKYKEMTVEEIEKELGYKVKVIADKG